MVVHVAVWEGGRGGLGCHVMIIPDDGRKHFW